MMSNMPFVLKHKVFRMRQTLLIFQVPFFAREKNMTNGVFINFRQNKKTAYSCFNFSFSGKCNEEKRI